MSDTRTTEQLAAVIDASLMDVTDVAGHGPSEEMTREALDTLTARLTAYEAEHEANGEGDDGVCSWCIYQTKGDRTHVEPCRACSIRLAHDNAERVRRGE